MDTQTLIKTIKKTKLLSNNQKKFFLENLDDFYKSKLTEFFDKYLRKEQNILTKINNNFTSIMIKSIKKIEDRYMSEKELKELTNIEHVIKSWYN